MNRKLDDIRRLEERAARTWPAEAALPQNGWLLRASDGTTRRANSELTAGDGPSGDGWLEHIEVFYRERELTPIFQMSDGSPHGLDELLERRGYAKETPCVVMTAQAAAAAEAARHSLNGGLPDTRLQISDRADSQWLDDFIRLEQFPASRLPFYEGLCGRMPAGTHCFSLQRDGTTIAVATVVGEDGWAALRT